MTNSLTPCPICGRPADEKRQPFCSKRCADVDLHRWLAGVYTVPVVEDEDDDGVKPDDPPQDERGSRGN